MPDLEILTTCRFYVELTITGSPYPIDGIFMDCKGFKYTQEVIEICEVTPNQWGTKNKPGQLIRTKIPGNVKTNNLVLRRGLTVSKSIWQWFEDVQSGNWGKQRRDGSLAIYNQKGKAQARFQFQRAWPTNYTITDVNAGSNDIAIEEMEMVCEQFKRVAADGEPLNMSFNVSSFV